MPATQSNREIAINSQLGKDVLLFQNMKGFEAISQIGEYLVDMASESNNINSEEILGTKLSISLKTSSNSQRYFSGWVCSFTQIGRKGRLGLYQAVIRPWFWFTTLSQDCRIFQDQNVIQIIRRVFESYSMADYDLSSIGGNFPILNYCVQYCESDFQFVSRLMENAGIYYFFKSGSMRNTMVLGNSTQSYPKNFSSKNISYVSASDRGNQQSDVLSNWQQQFQIKTGIFSMRNYDFEKPRSSHMGSLQVHSSISRSHAHSSFEKFDFPGNYLERKEGERIAKLRIEEKQHDYEMYYGESNSRELMVGLIIKIKDHPNSKLNGEFVINKIDYNLTGNEFESNEASPVNPLTSIFTSFEKKTEYRPQRITPKPIIPGPQTALVVGKDNEEIWTDKHGRIKIQFHWERERKENEQSSCWVRVMQNIAGRRWGNFFLPRIGQEVIVSFLNGDPDQPLVTGTVYNAENMPPYDLPQHMTRSTIKSISSKGGQGYNELRFEDKKGKEQLFIHAERNLDKRVKNDYLEWVSNNRHRIIDKDSFEQINGEAHRKISKSLTEEIDENVNINITKDKISNISGNKHQKIGKDKVIEISGNANQKVAKDRSENNDGDFHLNIGKNLNIETGSTTSLNTKQKLQIKSGVNCGIDAGTEIHLKAGVNLVIEASAGISLKVGSSFIAITPASIAITGNPILLNSGGSSLSGSGSSPISPKNPESPQSPNSPKLPEKADKGE